jgi:hypothetical protein
MPYSVNLTLFVLAFNIVGFAEGYLLRDMGLAWLVLSRPTRFGTLDK